MEILILFGGMTRLRVGMQFCEECCEWSFRPCEECQEDEEKGEEKDKDEDK